MVVSFGPDGHQRKAFFVLLIVGLSILSVTNCLVNEKSKFSELDSELLVSSGESAVEQLSMIDDDDVPAWKEEGYEPYSDELDSYVTVSGVPDPLDDDSVRHQQYESWLQNYKRVPNVPKQLWSYDNADTAPDVWSSLEKEYLFCDADLAKTTSSPIDIQTAQAQQQCYGPSFEVQSAPVWGPSTATLSELFDRSFIVDVANCRPGQGCQAAPMVDNMALERIVFHTPSEHKLNGETFDMELQFMHCKAGASLFAQCRPEMGVAVLLKDAGTSYVDPPFLTQLAMTVKWYIPSQVLKVSSSIIAAFKAREGENVRPAFALGTRPLLFMNAERPEHWTYRGPRGQSNWGSARFPWLAYTSCGKPEDCEQLPDQASRDTCLATQKLQSPIDIYTNECQPNVDWGRPCVAQAGLRPLQWNVGNSMSQPMKIYLKDCNTCKPCTNVNNAYTLTLSVPGTRAPVFLSPGGGGGCDSLEACKTATGYDAPTITYQNSIYALREIVFHTPSEHTVDGAAAAGEVQLVAELVDCVKCTCPGWGSAGYGGQQWCCCAPNNNAKKVLIQSVLLARGRPQSAPAWFSAVAAVAKSVTGEPLALLPDLYFRDVSSSIHATMSTYFFYDGSLSTPPCSTQVQWMVVKKPLEVGPDDLNAIAALSVGGNARAVQPLNGRVLSVAGTVQL